MFLEWRKIIDLLEREISGVRAALTLPGIEASGVELKAFEDALDAVISAWVGICALEGRAKPYGDETSAIWILRHRLNPHRRRKRSCFGLCLMENAGAISIRRRSATGSSSSCVYREPRPD